MSLPRLALTAFLVIASTTFAEDRARTMTLDEAHRIALEKHPRISVADLRALAAKQVVKEVRSNYYPLITANAGAVVADSDTTRIVSNPLTVSSALNRASGSLTVTQIITDFGRTDHLSASAKLKAGAEEKNIEATREQILLQVDGAFFGALEAGALISVAEETVKTRTEQRDQIATLAQNKIKSDLDLSFAETNLQEALLLLSRAQNDQLSAYATLAALLDEPKTTAYRLVPKATPEKLPREVTGLLELAVNNRPDLQRLRLEFGSAKEFALAEAALSRPTLIAQGGAGVLPWHGSSLNENYAVGGIMLSWPIFTGGLNTARKKEADLRAKAIAASIRDEENNAVRDVRLAWLAATNALERMDITAKLVDQSKKSLELAQARYDAGSLSIVELSQAQLGLTSAQITNTNARYEYLIRRSLLDYQTGSLR